MRRLLVAALVLAAAAAAGVALHSPLGTAIDRILVYLGDWYDRREGLGELCAEASPRAYPGPAGLALAIPACWRPRVEDENGIETHLLVDETLGLAGRVMLRSATPANPVLWDRVQAELAVRLGQRGVGVGIRGEFHVVRSAFVRRSDKIRMQWLEWYGSSDRCVYQIVYRVPKPYLSSPKVREQLARIEAVVASVKAPDDDACP